MIVHYIRKLFCKHELEHEDMRVEKEFGFGNYKKGVKRYVFCKKCGYHSSHWKSL